MSQDGTIQYQYAILTDGVDQMLTTNGNIAAQVQDLTQQTAKILTDWTGSAATAYNASANRIANDLTTSNDTLRSTANSVNTGQENMNSKDRQMSNMFH
jgi:WXG100 family type VII secretion target